MIFPPLASFVSVLLLRPIAMPLYPSLNKSHPSSWTAQSSDTLVTPSGVGSSRGSPNDVPLGATLTPSPVSSTTESLPFTLASRLIEQTPTEPPELRQAGVDSQSSTSEHDQILPEESQVEELVSTSLDPGTRLSSLELAHQQLPAITTDHMRSLEILDSSSDRIQRQSFVAQYSPLTAPSSSIDHLSPANSADVPVTRRPADHPHHVFHKSRGASKLSHPIQPIEGPPPPVLHKAKGPWHKDEDAALLYWVSHLGTGKWVDIARRVGSRTGKQCRERWTNQLSPEIDHSAFRHEEDLMIITLQNNLQANKWCEVAKYLPGRPENAIKNRWNSRDLQRKRDELEAMRERDERQANMASACTPFGFMLQNHQGVDHAFNQVQSPYAGSSKRVRSSPPANNFEFHHRLGLPYQTPRSVSNVTKKHRVIIEPHSVSQRDHPGTFSCANKLGFSDSNQNEALLPYQNLVRLNGAEMANLASQANLGQDQWFGYHTTPPPSASSSSNARVQCLQRNQETGTGLGHYYSTPTQSPTYQIEASSTNSILSNESSDPRHPARYQSTSYDEIATPKSASLINPAYSQPLFVGPKPQSDVKPNMYYNCYIPEMNDRKALGMDFERPEKSHYDTLLGDPTVGGGYASLIKPEIEEGYHSLFQPKHEEPDRDENPRTEGQLDFEDHHHHHHHPNHTLFPCTRQEHLSEVLGDGKRKLDQFDNSSHAVALDQSALSNETVPLDTTIGTNSSHENSIDCQESRGWSNLDPSSAHHQNDHLDTVSRIY